MANTFRMTNEANVTTAAEAIYTVPSSTTAVVIGIMLTNTSSSTIKSSVKLVSTTATSTNSGASNANETVFLVRDIPISGGSSFEVMAGNKVVLQTGDILQAQSDTASSLDIAISYMEIT